ncbi:MAG: M23 family metallopeptidase [Candidatus Peribacteraceae bacterium]|nr:M23 family metallopeptidase [Candidatus Peribacteraceae bacterium]
MLHIEIEIERPIATLVTIVGVVGAIVWFNWGGSGQRGEASAMEPVHAVSTQGDRSGGGGDDRMALHDAEDEARFLRMQQAVLSRREEILRYTLQLLEEQAQRLGDTSPGESAALIESEQQLIALLTDRQAGEEKLLETLRQMWEAEGAPLRLQQGDLGAVILDWPVEPAFGLSATFLDAAYEARFGIPHRAIDIPVEQGSAVLAAADGVVESIADNGMGYSYLIVNHGGYATLYGHVQEFLVQEGQVVHKGDIVARSGGLPGTKGAGLLSTGPHLHFEVIVQGERLDPLTFLPARAGLTGNSL